MRKRLIGLVLAVVMIMLMVPTTVLADGSFTQGDGTESNPYGISTPEQLHAVRDYPDAHFILLNDIDMLAATSEGGAYWNDGAGWEPIGSQEIPFTGVFDGSGKKIVSLMIDRYDSEVGLFGYINHTNAIVKDLILEDCDVDGKYHVGGIAGFLKGKITNCHVSGFVHAASNQRVGGIAGKIEGENGNRARIEQCTFTGRVLGNYYVAGIAGLVGDYCTVSQCYNSGQIKGYDYVGGIVGWLDNSIVENCFNIGNIDGYKNTGSLIGSVEDRAAILQNSYSAGYFEGSIDNVLFGTRHGTVTNCYVLSSTQQNGLLAEEMTHQANFSGFDFDNIWEIKEGQSWPNLRNIPFVYANAIKLNRKVLNIDFTGPLKLTVTIDPINATNQNILWESSNTNVATVSDGEVTAVSTGTAVITVKTIDGQFSDSCSVIVGNDPVLVTIPDINLESALIQSGADLNGDNELSEYEMSKITELDLSGKEISDITGIEYATGLYDLNISKNDINDVSTLSGLTKLKRLETGNNPLNDITPIADLVNLTELRIDNNNIRSISCLKTLANLQVLIASNNRLTSLNGIESLRHLHVLQVINNEIDDISAIAGSKSLTCVDLANNQISDISAFSGLTNIICLDLGRNQIKNISGLFNLANLRELNLWLNDLYDLNSMPKLTKLESLNIVSNNIQDISRITVLPNLKSLYASSNRISNISLIAGIQSIKTMDLQYNDISDIAPLESRTDLSTLYLNYNYLDISSGSPQKAIIDNLLNAGVYVKYNTQYTNVITINDENLKQGLIDEGLDSNHNGVITLGEIYTYDGSLDLSGRNITDLTGMENAQNLSWLDLSNNSIQNAHALNNLFNVEYLDLSDNKISDLAFVDYSSHINHIKTMKVSGNQITNVNHIDDMPWLNSLDISDNLIEDITILADNTNIKDLNVSNNYLDISEGSLQITAIQTMQTNGTNVIYRPQQIVGVEEEVIDGQLHRTHYNDDGSIDREIIYYGEDDTSVIKKINYYADGVRKLYKLFDTSGNLKNLVELYSSGKIKKINYYNTTTGCRYAYKLYDTAGRMKNYIYCHTDGTKPKKTNYYNASTGARKSYKLYDTQGRTTRYATCYSDGVKASKMNYYDVKTGKRTAYKTYRSDGTCSCYVKCDSNGKPSVATYYDKNGKKTKVVRY